MTLRTLLSAGMLLLHSGASSAGLLTFDYMARIDGSDRPGAPVGTLLTGFFSYDTDRSNPLGSFDYFPDAGSAMLFAQGEAGFNLGMDTRVINVTPGAPSDTMTMQSFISEDPNGWNMMFDFIEPGGPSGWLAGNSSLPTAFPENPDNGFITLYFTDEGNWVSAVEATILAVAPSAVPVPASGGLVGVALIGLGLFRAKKMPRR